MAAKRRARTPRRGRRRYHSLRRVPQAYPGIYLRLRLAPIIPGIAATIAVGAAADAQFLPEGARQWARARADAMGGAISEEAQKVFFDQPGLDTLVVRSLAHAARRLASLGRLWAPPPSRWGATVTGAWPPPCRSYPGAATTPS